MEISAEKSILAPDGASSVCDTAPGLQIAAGHYSDKGRKPHNQDFHGICVPQEPQLSAKGICVALADGISSSEVSQFAAETAVRGFFEDYYCTPDAWSVKTAAQQVLQALNSWLHAQTQRSEFRFEKDKGYVCTFSALVIKSTTAHLFHTGDSRIYRVQGNVLEQLTEDHRLWVSEEQSYLSRALGINRQLDIDYLAVDVQPGDTFILATDGVYEYTSDQTAIQAINSNPQDLNKAAQAIAEAAYHNGSGDNLTLQIVRIEQLPRENSRERYQKLTALPFPPQLGARSDFDGYTIVRQLHTSSRSHVYLAIDNDTQVPTVIKTPSIDLRGDAAYLERFLLEEWIARRIDNPHVLKPCQHDRERRYTYIASEYIEGQTLAQWMRDNPRPDLETVRAIIEQIARGLRAFHKLEMLHQDLRPENIMIDSTGTAKIIDFGSTRVAGLAEIDSPLDTQHNLGTAQFTAPEYFLGLPGCSRSDLYSLAVITYQMLSGRLPYGAEVARARSRQAQRRLRYQSVLDDERDIPAWVDHTLRRALHPDPLKRYGELSEFLYDLRHPSKAFLEQNRPPLIERNPVAVWQTISFVLLGIILYLLVN